MSILKLLAAPFDKIVSSIGKAIDDNVTNDEERQILANQLAEIEKTATLEMEKIGLEYDKQLTERHKMDMQSDDKWSKRVRPASLVFLLGVVSVLAVTDGNVVWNEYSFQIKESYIDLFQALLLTAFSFYFGGRTFEKVSKIRNQKKDDE